MTVIALERRPAASLDALLPVILLVGGSLNGLAVRAVESWSRHGADAIFLGVSPFELIVIAVAVWLMLRTPLPSAGRLPAAELAAVVAILVPSSAVSWAAVGGYGAILAWRLPAEHRTGPLLFVALALCALWSSVGVKWAALPLTTAEASIVAALVSLLRDDVVQMGNVVGTADHSIVLMTACSTLEGLPKALLGVVAIACTADRMPIRRHYAAVAIVAVLYAAANIVRLMTMVWSQPMFEIAHGPIGANIFDAATTMLVLAAGMKVADR